MMSGENILITLLAVIILFPALRNEIGRALLLRLAIAFLAGAFISLLLSR